MEGARYLDEGKLVIYRRNEIYYSRSLLSGKYVWRALGTRQLDEAVSKGWKVHHSLQTLLEQGLPITAKTFAAVIDEYVAAREKSKTGQREVIPRANAAKFIGRVLKRRKDAGPNDRLFVMPSGGPIITLADQFDAVLKHAGILRNSKGEKFTLYSLRHFYAVTSLRRGVGIYTVAKNMGTSVQMIETYYGKHATPPTFATALGN